jgi:hypothetical protein
MWLVKKRMWVAKVVGLLKVMLCVLEVNLHSFADF